MRNTDIKEKLVEKGLKVTPQRMAILEAIITLKNHPTAENIIEFIRKNHPNIATGTAYKILDTFVEKELIQKVKTENDVMRYDAELEKHHHLFCKESEKIEDYFNEEIDDMLQEYFKNKGIPNFQIEDIKLQISGKFTK
ncbi:MAG TPA: transcriptional repressor [Bacteroidales bacterium]